MKIWDALKLAADATVEIGRAVEAFNNGLSFGEFLKIPRQQAVDILSNAIDRMTAEQFDSFERTFLEFAQHQIHPLLKVRAMELYAWMKVMECARFDKWRGFCADTHQGAFN